MIKQMKMTRMRIGLVMLGGITIGTRFSRFAGFVEATVYTIASNDAKDRTIQKGEVSCIITFR